MNLFVVKDAYGTILQDGDMPTSPEEAEMN
jgi:hypothetical protein